MPSRRSRPTPRERRHSPSTALDAYATGPRQNLARVPPGGAPSLGAARPTQSLIPKTREDWMGRGVRGRREPREARDRRVAHGRVRGGCVDYSGLIPISVPALESPARKRRGLSTLAGAALAGSVEGAERGLLPWAPQRQIGHRAADSGPKFGPLLHPPNVGTEWCESLQGRLGAPTVAPRCRPRCVRRRLVLSVSSPEGCSWLLRASRPSLTRPSSRTSSLAWTRTGGLPTICRSVRST